MSTSSINHPLNTDNEQAPASSASDDYGTDQDVRVDTGRRRGGRSPNQKRRENSASEGAEQEMETPPDLTPEDSADTGTKQTICAVEKAKPALAGRNSDDNPGAGPQATASGHSAAAKANHHEDSTVAILELSEIATDTNIQGRAQMNLEKVEEYAERLKEGDKFPPIVVFKVGEEFLLADGFHRHAAACLAKSNNISVEVRRGTRKDAVRYSITANAVHGLARTNADKNRAATLALQEFPELSDHAIADMAKVSQPFVSRIRSQLITVISSEPRTGLDGRKRKAPKSKSKTENTQPTATPESTSKSEMAAQEDCSATARGTESQNQDKVEFDAEEEWATIEKYLRQQLEKWPMDCLHVIRQKLREFSAELDGKTKEGK